MNVTSAHRDNTSETTSAPPLALIVPAYKARFLADTLASIAAQPPSNFRCYVFDDASPESISPIVEKFSHRLPLTYHRFETNLGGRDLVAQWQRCIALTAEPWLWLVPDDDALEPGALQSVLDAIASAPPDLALLRLNVSTIGVSGETIHHRADGPARETVRTLARDCLLGRRHFSLGENIFRRSACETVGGYVPFPAAIGSDLTLLLKLARHGTVRNLAGPRFLFRHHGGAISSGATAYQALAVQGIADCCRWLDTWNRQTRVAHPLLFRYWTMRWFHAALKHWTRSLTPAQRHDLARFARRHWLLPRFLHNHLLFPRSPGP